MISYVSNDYGCMCRHVIPFVFNVYEYIRGHVHACASMYPCASVCRSSASMLRIICAMC